MLEEAERCFSELALVNTHIALLRKRYSARGLNLNRPKGWHKCCSLRWLLARFVDVGETPVGLVRQNDSLSCVLPDSSI